jgi:hypothetical protein
MGIAGRLPALVAAAATFAFGTAEGLYAGGGLTILSRNDLDGRHPVASGYFIDRITDER